MKLDETLLYYDGPQVAVFEEDGQRYLGVLYDGDDHNDYFTAVPVSIFEVNQVRRGEVDIHSLFTRDIKKITVNHNMTLEPFIDVEEWMLPEKGLYI